MVQDLDFDWTQAELVIDPVQAVVVYPAQNGVVIRQQKSLARDRDEVVRIPQHAIYQLIRRLQILQHASFVNAEANGTAEFEEILAAE